MRISDEQRQQFVHLLRTARESRGWKQYEAATTSGVLPSTLSRLEHGPYAGMRFEDIALLCRAYQIPLDSLAALLGMPTTDGEEVASELIALCAAVRSLESEQQAFVIRVLQAVLRGL